VLVARDRSGATTDFVLEAANIAQVSAALSPVLAHDIIVCTDGSPTLASVARALGLEHHALNLCAGIRVHGPGTSGTSTPTTADSRTGSVDSMAWLRRICPATWDGSVPWTGSGSPSAAPSNAGPDPRRLRPSLPNAQRAICKEVGMTSPGIRGADARSDGFFRSGCIARGPIGRLKMRLDRRCRRSRPAATPCPWSAKTTGTRSSSTRLSRACTRQATRIFAAAPTSVVYNVAGAIRYQSVRTRPRLEQGEAEVLWRWTWTRERPCRTHRQGSGDGDRVHTHPHSAPECVLSTRAPQ
jgi:hypothetical protein